MKGLGMRRFRWAALCAVGAVTLAGAARADTFTLTNTHHTTCGFGDPSAVDCSIYDGNGFANAIPGGYQLYGSDDSYLPPDLRAKWVFQGPQNTTTLTATALTAESLTFNYSYNSADFFGTQFDPGGYVFNGVLHQLSADRSIGDPLVHVDQTGLITFNLNPGDTYGFYISTGDSNEGPGRISFALQTLETPGSAPEPATWAMMIMGFGLAGVALRRRQAGRAT